MGLKQEARDDLAPVLPHMRFVDTNRVALAALGQRWDMLDVLSGVIDIGTEVTETRTEFAALTDTLIDALAGESLKKVTAALGAKAQVTIDIVIRNLFERTADIGFMATDEDLRLFLANDVGTAAQIRERLSEYRRKYSVYNNVVLLGPAGEVRAAAVPDGLPAVCTDAFVRLALDTADPYVESFAPSDLAPGAGPALIYAHRVAGTAGPAHGVLALQFGFAAELAGVFARLLTPDDWTVLTLLDAHGVVLASSDAAQLPAGCRLAVDPRERHQIIRHAGRRYVAVARATGGYQGYAGPGWRGCALVPIDVAFEEEGAGIKLDEHRSRMIAGNAHLFPDLVRQIPVRAETIQAELDRTVWNGALVLPEGSTAADEGAARRTLLAEISATGARTRHIIADAVTALNQTAIGAIVSGCGASAALAIDIMDRNLYERANDCRWWALTTRFRNCLAQSVVTDAHRAELTAILAHINGLYTVYTNLILFDRDGTIQAVSDPAPATLVGTPLPRTLVERFTARADSSFYGVSDFAPTPLYGNQPAYIFGAPVLHPTEAGRVVGGIAIVFDTAPQLRSMLADCVSVQASAAPGSGLVFVDERRRILATTLDRLQVGATLELPAALFVNDGQPHSDVLAWHGDLYAIGVCASSGYREFKGPADSYRDIVFAVCLVHLCADEGVSTTRTIDRSAAPAPRLDGPGRQIATFMVGDRHLALEATDVVEAVVLTDVARLPDRGAAVMGYGIHKGRGIIVFDPCRLFGVTPATAPGANQIEQRTTIVFRAGGTRYGLLIDALGAVRLVGTDRIRDGACDPAATGVRALVQTEQSPILLLDPDRLAALLLENDAAPAMVGPPGLEPGTSRLKVACSTN